MYGCSACTLAHYDVSSIVPFLLLSMVVVVKYLYSFHYGGSIVPVLVLSMVVVPEPLLSTVVIV